MTLKGDKSSTIENCMLRMTGSAWTSSTASLRKVVAAPLNPDKIRPGFSMLEGSSPICLITDACKKSVKLPGVDPAFLMMRSHSIGETRFSLFG